MMAAVAVVLMSIGTIVPVATYAVPVLCMLICSLVNKCCGTTIAWAWYGAVAILSLLLAPDREAAAVFLVLGYYPIVKTKLDRTKGKWLWKILLFNGSILLLYWVLLNIIGMQQLIQNHVMQMTMRIEAMRNMLLHYAWNKDNGCLKREEASIAKQFCSESANEVVDHAMQIMAGIGFCGSRVSRIYRDLRITRISGGTGEIQTIIAARAALRKVDPNFGRRR